MQKINLKKAQKGFTLIELLVVIVIIGILAATASVNFSKSTDKAKKSALQTDVGNLYSALTMYNATEDDNFEFTVYLDSTDADAEAGLLLTPDLETCDATFYDSDPATEAYDGTHLAPSESTDTDKVVDGETARATYVDCNRKYLEQELVTDGGYMESIPENELNKNGVVIAYDSYLRSKIVVAASSGMEATNTIIAGTADAPLELKDDLLKDYVVNKGSSSLLRGIVPANDKSITFSLQPKSNSYASSGGEF